MTALDFFDINSNQYRFEEEALVGNDKLEDNAAVIPENPFGLIDLLLVNSYYLQSLYFSDTGIV